MTGSQLKARRTAAGVSQEWLARKLDVTLSTVSRWEQLKDGEIPGSRMLELALDSVDRERKKKAGRR